MCALVPAARKRKVVQLIITFSVPPAGTNSLNPIYLGLSASVVEGSAHLTPNLLGQCVVTGPKARFLDLNDQYSPRYPGHSRCHKIVDVGVKIRNDNSIFPSKAAARSDIIILCFRKKLG